MRLEFILAGFCLLVICSLAFAQQGVPRSSAVSIALEMASRLESDSFAFEEASQRIAFSYWKRGDAANAFLQADKLPPEERLRLLSYLAESTARDHKNDLARQAFTRALNLIASDKSLKGADGIRGLARSAAQAGDVDAGLKFAEMLDEGSEDKASALVLIAHAASARGQKDRAMALLDLAVKQFDGFDESEQDRLVQIVSMASVLFMRLGEKERALALVNRANEFVTAQAKPDVSDAEALALLNARIGGSNAAVRIESLQEPRALISLAIIFGDRGEESAALSYLSRARQNLESTDEPEMAGLVDAYIRLERPDDALKVLAEMSNIYRASECAVNLATALNKKSRKADAIAALDVAFDRTRRIVSEKSEDIPGSASSSIAQEKSHTLLKLGQAYVDLAEPGKALECAKAIDQPQYQAMGLARAAVAHDKINRLTAQSLLAKAYKLSRTAEEYNHDAFREKALYEIAQAYARVGDRDSAANVVRRVLDELWENDPARESLITGLFEVGAMVESEGIELDKKSEVMLARILKRFNDDN